MPVTRLRRSVVAVATACTLAGAAPAHATFAGINGELAFTAPGGRLAAVPLGGLPGPGTAARDPTPLAPAGARDVHWSPDAAWIAYSSAATGDPEVYRLNVARPGSLPERLTTSPGADTDPSFSADGRSVAFTSERSGNADIWVMAADGSQARQVTTSPAVDQQAEYAPTADGRLVFESDRDGDRELYLVADDGAGEARLTDHPGVDADASWSPDGRSIAYATGTGAFPEDIAVVAAAAGSPPRTIAPGGSAGNQFPAWSPDGRQVAYSTFSEAPSLHVADVSSGVTRHAGYGWDPDWGVLRPVEAAAPPASGTATIQAAPDVLVRPPGAERAQPLAAASGGDAVAHRVAFGTTVNAQPAGRSLAVDLDVALVRGGPVLQTRVTGGVYTLRRSGRTLTFDMAPPRCPRGGDATASVLPRNDITIRRTGGRGAVSTRSRRRHVRTHTYDTEYRVIESCRRMVIRVLDGKLTVTQPAPASKPPPLGGGAGDPSPRRTVLAKGEKVVIG